MPDASHDAPRALGERCFTDADQRAFAAVTGDINPMHMDDVAARRLISGRQVVHGVHTLIDALDRIDPPGSGAVVRCEFHQPISVGDTAAFSCVAAGAARRIVRASVDGMVSTEIDISWGDQVAALPPVKRPIVDGSLPLRRVGRLAAALDEPPGSQADTVFSLSGEGGAELTRRYPAAANWAGATGLGALGALSYFVGMVCPGLHSVFSSLQFTLGDPHATDLRLRLQRHDPRFALVIVAFDGPVRGELRAFLRPPPQPQPTTRELLSRVAVDEFAGTRSLVIGGSRGLGELSAKLIAAGGGDVTVSYARGRDDALRVAADISAAGRGRCAVLGLDVEADGFDALAAQARFDAVYYFATPRIYRRKASVFDAGAFEAFTRFYLTRFHELCVALERRGEGRTRVYLPSTVFITERPKGMTEYAMAKAAAEVLADDLNRTLKHVEVVHTRLPRLATDQTSSILGLEVASNVDTLLPVVRRMSGRAA